MMIMSILSIVVMGILQGGKLDHEHKHEEVPITNILGHVHFFWGNILKATPIPITML